MSFSFTSFQNRSPDISIPHQTVENLNIGISTLVEATAMDLPILPAIPVFPGPTNEEKEVEKPLEQKKPLAFAPEEHLAIYEVKAPVPACGDEETRMYISYKGDVANAYLNGKLVADSFYDGTDWIISLNRLKETINFNPLVIRIDGLKSVNEQIYFEKNVDPAECVTPVLSDIQVNQEYRFETVVD